VESTASDITPLLTQLEIHVAEDKSFTTRVRDIFKETVVTHKSAKESRRWLSEPSYGYWPQQLNFAVWCATAGCGVSLTDPTFATLPSVIRGFLRFHVYDTTRRILYELGVPLPGDSPFTQKGNPYKKAAFERLCIQFGLPRKPDFRWKGGRNHGLGDVFVFYPGEGYRNVHVIRGYDTAADEYPSHLNLFSDEGGTYNSGKQVGYIRNDDHGGVQYSWFAPPKGEGLTKAGLGRLDRSVEAFVYTVLGRR
jgi:hypothetical protein